ncbi:hypothetical protein BVX93_02090, partial [bacterium B13(2017)]
MGINVSEVEMVKISDDPIAYEFDVDGDGQRVFQVTGRIVNGIQEIFEAMVFTEKETDTQNRILTTITSYSVENGNWITSWMQQSVNNYVLMSDENLRIYVDGSRTWYEYDRLGNLLSEITLEFDYIYGGEGETSVLDNYRVQNSKLTIKKNFEFDVLGNPHRVEVNEYLLDIESGADGFIGTGDNLVLDVYGQPQIDMSEWKGKSGRILNQSGFTIKGMARVREVFEYKVLSNGIKVWSKGENVELAYDVHGNVIKEVKALFRLEKQTDVEIDLTLLVNVDFDNLDLNEQTLVINKIHEFVTSSYPDQVNTKVKLNNGIEIDIKNVGGVFYDTLSETDKQALRNGLLSYYIQGNPVSITLQSALIKKYKEAEYNKNSDHDSSGNANNVVRENFEILDKNRIFVKGRLNMFGDELSKDVFKAISGDITVTEGYNFRNSPEHVMIHSYMFDYVLDPLGVKVFIGGQDISNEYDYYGANL